MNCLACLIVLAIFLSCTSVCSLLFRRLLILSPRISSKLEFWLASPSPDSLARNSALSLSACAPFATMSFFACALNFLSIVVEDQISFLFFRPYSRSRPFSSVILPSSHGLNGFANAFLNLRVSPIFPVYFFSFFSSFAGGAASFFFTTPTTFPLFLLKFDLVLWPLTGAPIECLTPL